MSFREFFQTLWIIRTIIFSIWSVFEKWWFLSNYKSFVRFTKSLTLSKKRLAQVFSCEFCEISQNTFSAEHFRTTASLVLFLYSYNYLFINNIFVSVCHVLQSRLPSYSNCWNFDIVKFKQSVLFTKDSPSVKKNCDSPC